MNKHFTIRSFKLTCCFLLSLFFFSTSISAQSAVATRNVSNTTLCSNNDISYGVFIKLDGEDNYHTLQWASFTEYDDGTATLIGTAVNNSNSDIQFNVDLTFTGRTFTPPAGSPKDHHCSNPSTDDWYYYTGFSGTYMGVGQCWGTTLSLTNFGAAFQVGNGANVTNDGSAFGASGWATITVDSQNAWGPQISLENNGNGQEGDINIDLSGQPLTPPGACSNVTNGGSISGTQTVCAGSAASTLTNSSNPTGGSGTIEYIWLSSTTSCPTSLNQQIAGATGANYDPGVLSQTTYFVRCSRRSGCTEFNTGESNCVTVTVDNSADCNDNGGGGGGGGGTGDCADIAISTGSGSITVAGLDNAPITSVQIFNSSWGQEFNCFADCDSPTQTVNVGTGTYYVYVKFYNAGYGLICEVNETVTVGGGGGVTDNDNDGVPADQDCDDNDPSVPATVGSSCNDGNANTTNDVIQADGCTCAGTPVTSSCTKYAITDSHPECGTPANEESGVFYQRDCGGSFTVWKAGSDLMLTENGDGTATISGSILNGNQTGDVLINLSDYETTGQNWTNACYNAGLTPQYFYTSFTGTVTVAGTVFTIEQKASGADFVFGTGANNQSDGSLGIGAWTTGTWGSCIEMFASLTPLNPGDTCDDGNANTNNDVISPDGCTCAGTTDDCVADAGSLNATNSSVQLTNGSATLSATAGGGLNMPAGFEKIFVLTQGTNLVIQDVANSPSFTVSQIGNYRIHTLVYDPNTLDLGIVQLGSTTGGDVNSLLIQGGGSICASLDVAGAPISVTNGGGGGGGNAIDLELTATGTGGNVGAYANFSVTFTITNAGSSAASNVVVNIPQPSNAVFQGGNAASTSQGTYDAFASFNWTVGNLSAGQTETITLNYFSLANPPYTVYGQVLSADGDDADSTPGNGSAPTPNEDDEAAFTTGGDNGGGGGGGGDTCPFTLVANVSNIQCNNNGTPNDASDDTFTFAVTVTGGNPWGWSGGDRSGDFGSPVNFGPYNISAGNVSFTIVDNDNQTCTVDVDVTPPATCSDGNGGGGGGGGGADDCSDISITNTDNSITITGLDNAPLTAVWIFDASYTTIFNCSYGCNATETVNNLAAGTYHVIVKKLNPDWSVICEVNETITLGGGGGQTGVLTLNCPANVNVTAAPGANTATAFYNEPTRSTTCTLNGGGLGLIRTAGPASGAAFPVGTTTVTFKATDNCGNEETCSFTVTVNAANANLSINCPNDITVNAAPGANSANVQFNPATANTNCGQAGVNVNQTAGPTSGSLFPAGTTTITYTATDNCGNTKTCSFTVTVNTSNSNVSVSCPANINVDAQPGQTGANVNYGNATGNTNCATGGLNITVTDGPASGAVFPVGTTTVKYTATDNCGGMAMCTFTVTVNATAVQPCEVRTVTDAASGCSDDTPVRGFYANNLLTSVSGDGARYSIHDGVLEEFADGTARFTGRFINVGNSNVRWNADITLSGRTFNAPANSPKHSDCYSFNESDFYYYTAMNGTLTGTNLLAGGEINISLMGQQAFQFGTGANLSDQGLFGASAWLSYTIVSQPSGSAHLENGAQLDLNWILTGGALDCPDAPDTSSCDLDVLFVVGNTNLSSGDHAVKERLESKGYSVMVIDEHDAQTSSANGKDLVIVSSTVLSSTINTKFTNVTVPVMTWESYLFDDLRLTGTHAGSDYGTQTGVRQYTVASNHPINAGLSGTFNVFSTNQEVSWGYPAAVSNDVGYIPSNPNKCMIIVYDTGQSMVGGFTAPARRAGFFLRNNSAYYLNNNGWKLFDQTVYWLTDCTPGQVNQFVSNETPRVADIAEERTEETVAVEFGIYPNPATDLVNISLENAQGMPVVIEVYDQLGRIVKRAEADAAYNSVYRINTASFEAGMYIISVQAADRPALTKQLVIMPH